MISTQNNKVSKLPEFHKKKALLSTAHSLLLAAMDIVIIRIVKYYLPLQLSFAICNAALFLVFDLSLLSAFFFAHSGSFFVCILLLGSLRSPTVFDEIVRFLINFEN